jgi:DNA primase
VPIAFDNETKDRVRMAVNIVDLISSYLEVRRQGRGFVARCPFHDDRHPSMQINPDRQSWKCWVCDIGGDVFSFVMQKEGVTFPEALQMLADRAGIELEPRSSRPTKESSQEKRSLFQAMQWAVSQYHECFRTAPEAESARQYVAERGLTDESVGQFQLGFAPESWTWLLDRGADASISSDVLESVGLLAKSERGTRFDRFRGRLLFPIQDPTGRPIAVGGRILPGAARDSAKYINCNETRLYHKNQTLYGLDLARETMRRTKQAIVMEGYTDVMMAFQHGISNAVACCGTALGENHIKLLKRYCDTVVLLLDGDEAGQRRSAEILELFLAAQMDLRVLTLPDQLDPCDYLIRNGGDALRGLIEGSVDALEHKIRTVCTGFDPLLDTHRAIVALEDVLQSLARVPHSAMVSSDSARLRQDQVIVRLSRQFGIEASDIRSRLDGMRRRAAQLERSRGGGGSSDGQGRSAAGVDGQVKGEAQDVDGIRFPGPTSSGPKRSNQELAEAAVEYRYSELQPTECELLEILIHHPELVSLALERFPLSNLETATARTIYQLFLDLELEGHALDFQSVMSATENPKLKSALTSLEDHATRKASKSTMTPEERFHSLCARWSHHEEAAHQTQQMRELEQKSLAPEAELDLLQSLLQQAKIRHGIIPADG